MKITIIISLILFGGYYIIRQHRQLGRLRLQSADRLRYIKTLIEIVYTYRHDTAHMAIHLQDEMVINKLLSYHIIDDRCHEYFSEDFKSHKHDKLLYLLYEDGFNPRELCVIFSLNNPNSVHVKCHRINKKLNGGDGIYPLEQRPE